MFKIAPHFRLQEWVAEEKGYFKQEGLDHEFREFIRSSNGAHHDTVGQADRKSTRLNSSHPRLSRMPSSA